MQSYHSRIDRLKKKYGLDGELVNLVNVVEGSKDDFVKELEDMGLVEPELPSF